MLIPTAIVEVQPGGAEAVDPVQEMLGTADTAFEFNTTDLSGLTALGTSPTVENSDTRISGHYYLELAAQAGVNWRGRYVAATPPFTAVTKVTAFSGWAGFNAFGLFIGESTPGAMHTYGPRLTGTNTPNLQVVSWAGPTGTGASVAAAHSPLGWIPVYLLILANSSDDVDTFFSFNGYVWTRFQTDINPTYTVGCVGLTGNSEHPTVAVTGAADYLRVWNSAITVPGSL